MSCLSTSACMASSTQQHFKYIQQYRHWSLHSSDITWFLSQNSFTFQRPCLSRSFLALPGAWSFSNFRFQLKIHSAESDLPSERGHPLLLLLLYCPVTSSQKTYIRHFTWLLIYFLCPPENSGGQRSQLSYSWTYWHSINVYWLIYLNSYLDRYFPKCISWK